MPNGKVHATATLIEAVTIPASMVIYGLPASESIACAIGVLLTLSINPDLDLTRRFPRNHPARIPWYFIWYPYSWFLPHRSPISHWPLIGTLFRIAYLVVFFLWIGYVFGFSDKINPLLYWIFVGMALSDTIHFLMDTVTTWLKRR